MTIPTDEFNNPLLHIEKKRRKPKPDVPYERQEQAEVRKALVRRGMVFTVGLEGVHKDKSQRWAATHAGMSRGNPDISISDPVPGRQEVRRVHLEMKRRKPLGRPPTPEQLARHRDLHRCGELVFVCYGADEAKAVLEQLWGPEPVVAQSECNTCGKQGPRSAFQKCPNCPRLACAGCMRDGWRRCGRCV